MRFYYSFVVNSEVTFLFPQSVHGRSTQPRLFSHTLPPTARLGRSRVAAAHHRSARSATPPPFHVLPHYRCTPVTSYMIAALQGSNPILQLCRAAALHCRTNERCREQPRVYLVTNPIEWIPIASSTLKSSIAEQQHPPPRRSSSASPEHLLTAKVYLLFCWFWYM